MSTETTGPGPDGAYADGTAARAVELHLERLWSSLRGEELATTEETIALWVLGAGVGGALLAGLSWGSWHFWIAGAAAGMGVTSWIFEKDIDEPKATALRTMATKLDPPQGIDPVTFAAGVSRWVTRLEAGGMATPVLARARALASQNGASPSELAERQRQLEAAPPPPPLPSGGDDPKELEEDAQKLRSYFQGLRSQAQGGDVGARYLLYWARSSSLIFVASFALLYAWLGEVEAFFVAVVPGFLGFAMTMPREFMPADKETFARRFSPWIRPELYPSPAFYVVAFERWLDSSFLTQEEREVLQELPARLRALPGVDAATCDAVHAALPASSAGAVSREHARQRAEVPPEERRAGPIQGYIDVLPLPIKAAFSVSLNREPDYLVVTSRTSFQRTQVYESAFSELVQGEEAAEAITETYRLPLEVIREVTTATTVGGEMFAGFMGKTSEVFSIRLSVLLPIRVRRASLLGNTDTIQEIQVSVFDPLSWARMEALAEDVQGKVSACPSCRAPLESSANLTWLEGLFSGLLTEGGCCPSCHAAIRLDLEKGAWVLSP